MRCIWKQGYRWVTVSHIASSQVMVQQPLDVQASQSLILVSHQDSLILQIWHIHYVLSPDCPVLALFIESIPLVIMCNVSIQ
jgi:hypothetical protein